MGEESPEILKKKVGGMMQSRQNSGGFQQFAAISMMNIPAPGQKDSQ